MSWSKPISDWSRATFRAATPQRALDRTDDEFCELLEAQSAEEAADVVICLCGFAAAKGFDLAAAVEAKMAINRQRKWKLNGDGTAQHIPEGEAE